MSKKHTYRTVDVQKLVLAKVLEQLVTLVVVIAIDVAKRRQVAAFTDAAGQPAFICHWDHPRQNESFLGLVDGLKAAGKQVQMVMEPSGTYGDALRHRCREHGCEVFMLNPKKTHDAKELFDGVPSQHDAKDATVIARLHAQKLSRPWEPPSDQERTLRALVSQREIHAEHLEQMHGQLEALQARHFPEFEQHLDLRGQKSAMRLLVDYPSAGQMAQDKKGVETLVGRHSRGRIGPDKLQGLLEAAQNTQGVPMLKGEADLVSAVAQEAVRKQELIQALKPPMESLLAQMPQTASLVAFLGVTTTAVLLAHLGDLNRYGSAGALQKACGLNLKVSVSGRDNLRKNPPGLHITKRGPGIVRKYLYLATLRWLQSDATARAWYEKRQGYTEPSKQRAVVALMRKLVSLLWHLSRGACYEPSRLFDLRRLEPKMGPREGFPQRIRREVSAPPN